jgi:competence CoiA-like predicted nuclease
MAQAGAMVVFEALEYFGVIDAVKDVIKASASKLMDVLRDPASYRERGWLRQISDLRYAHEKLKNLLEVKGPRMTQLRISNIMLKMKNIEDKVKMLLEKIQLNKTMIEQGGCPLPDTQIKRMLTQNAKKLDDRYNVSTFKYQPKWSSDVHSVYYDKVKNILVFVFLGGDSEVICEKTTQDMKKLKKVISSIEKKKKDASILLVSKDIGGGKAVDLFYVARESKKPLKVVVGGTCCGEKIKGLRCYERRD